jgi:hypothetical protein
LLKKKLFVLDMQQIVRIKKKHITHFIIITILTPLFLQQEFTSELPYGQ